MVRQRLAEVTGMSVCGNDGSFSIEDARLLFRGAPLKADAPLQTLGVDDGSVLRLLPPLFRAHVHENHGMTAPRGLLMTGTQPWPAVPSRRGNSAGPSPHWQAPNTGRQLVD